MDMVSYFLPVSIVFIYPMIQRKKFGVTFMHYICVSIIWHKKTVKKHVFWVTLSRDFFCFCNVRSCILVFCELQTFTGSCPGSRQCDNVHILVNIRQQVKRITFSRNTRLFISIFQFSDHNNSSLSQTVPKLLNVL